MTTEDVVAYLKENPLPKDVTPEDFINELQNALRLCGIEDNLVL